MLKLLAIILLCQFFIKRICKLFHRATKNRLEQMLKYLKILSVLGFLCMLGIYISRLVHVID